MSAFITSERNTTNQINHSVPQNPTAVAEALNQGKFIDPELIDQHIGQLWGDINNSLQLVNLLTQRKNSQIQQEMSSFEAFMGMAGIYTPKTNNIFAPKPLHANPKLEARIGRSHSMFVTTNPIKPEVSTGDKSIGSEKQSEEEGSQLSEKKDSLEASNRKRMNVYKCPHTDRKHYAKNMCNNCYHKQGRNKKATKCPHRDRQNYAKGKCQNCYLNDYHKVKRRMKKEQTKEINDLNVEIDDRKISVETSYTDGNLRLINEQTVAN